MPAEDNDISEQAWAVWTLLQGNLAPNYRLSLADEEEVIQAAMKHHGRHLDIHGVIPESLDAFKFLCGLGNALLEGLEEDSPHQRDIILNALISTLNEILDVETERKFCIPPETQVLLHRFVQQGWFGNSKHSVCMNGLYMAYSCIAKAVASRPQDRVQENNNL